MLFSLLSAVFALFMLFYGPAHPTFFIIGSAALVPHLLFAGPLPLVIGPAFALLLFILRKTQIQAVIFALLAPFAFFPLSLTVPAIALKPVIGIVLALLIHFRPTCFRFVISLFSAYIITWLFTGLYYFSLPFSILLFSALFLLSLIPGRKKTEF
jgi:hypothetical protein